MEDEEDRRPLVPHVLHVKLRLPYGDVPDFLPHPLYTTPSRKRKAQTLTPGTFWARPSASSVAPKT